MSLTPYNIPPPFPGSESATRFPLYWDSANRDRARQPDPAVAILDLQVSPYGTMPPVQGLQMLSAEIPTTQWTIEKAWSRLYFDQGILLTRCSAKGDKEFCRCNHPCEGSPRACSRLVVALRSPSLQRGVCFLPLDVPVPEVNLVEHVQTIEEGIFEVKFQHPHGLASVEVFRAQGRSLRIEGAGSVLLSGQNVRQIPSAREVILQLPFVPTVTTTWLVAPVISNPQVLTQILQTLLVDAISKKLDGAFCGGCINDVIEIAYDPFRGRFSCLLDFSAPHKCRCRRITFQLGFVAPLVYQRPSSKSRIPLVEYLGLLDGLQVCSCGGVCRCDPNIEWLLPLEQEKPYRKDKGLGPICTLERRLLTPSNQQPPLGTQLQCGKSREQLPEPKTFTLTGLVFLPDHEVTLCPGDVQEPEVLLQRLRRAFRGCSPGSCLELTFCWDDEDVESKTHILLDKITSEHDFLQQIYDNLVGNAKSIGINVSIEEGRIQVSSSSDRTFSIRFSNQDRCSPGKSETCALLGAPENDELYLAREVRFFRFPQRPSRSCPRSVWMRGTKDKETAEGKKIDQRATKCLRANVYPSLTCEKRVEFCTYDFQPLKGCASLSESGEMIIVTIKTSQNKQMLSCMIPGYSVKVSFDPKDPKEANAYILGCNDQGCDLVGDVFLLRYLSLHPGATVEIQVDVCFGVPLNLYLGGRCGEHVAPPGWPRPGSQGSVRIPSRMNKLGDCTCQTPRHCRYRSLKPLLLGVNTGRDFFSLGLPLRSCGWRRCSASIVMPEPPVLTPQRYVIVCLLEPSAGSRQNQHAAGESIVSNVLAKVQIYPKIGVPLVITNTIDFSSAPSRWRALGLSLLNEDHTRYNLHGQEWSATLLAYVQ